MSDSIPVLIVPTLNGHDRVLKMLRSIDYPVQQVIIIDNQNVSWRYYGAVGIESRLPNMNLIGSIHTIHMPSNLGVAGSWNLGIKSSPFAPYWLIVNDDVTFAPGSLARFAHEGEHVGTISLCADVSPWCAFTLGQDVVDCVGLFDEAYYPAYFEDTEYSHRVLELMGQDAIYHTDIAVDHVNSATINSGFNEANHRTYLANQELWGKQLAASCFDPVGWSLQTRRANDWGI